MPLKGSHKNADGTWSAPAAGFTEETLKTTMQSFTAEDVAGSNPRFVIEKFFPVRLFQHYRPLGDYRIVQESGAMIAPDTVPEDQDAGLISKLRKGEVYGLPIGEAKTLIAKGIAERADALPD